jgi:hypothetical protein
MEGVEVVTVVTTLVRVEEEVGVEVLVEVMDMVTKEEAEAVEVGVLVGEVVEEEVEEVVGSRVLDTTDLHVLSVKGWMGVGLVRR